MAFYLFILTGNGCCCSGIYQSRSFERCHKKEDIYCQSNHLFSFLFIHLFQFFILNQVDVVAAGRLENIQESSSEQKEVKFKCADCDYSTPRWDNMKRHRVGHEREEEFRCDLCNFSSSGKCQVSLHSSRFHRNPSAAPFQVN